MQNETSNDLADEIKSTLNEKLVPLKESVLSARDTINEKTCSMCECASDGIRNNPISAVLGAAVFGAAVCYMILEGSRRATFSEKYFSRPLVDAGDTVSSTLRSTYDNLKFW